VSPPARLGRLKQFDRLIKALQRGLGPVALGLMASTSFLLVRQAPGVWIGAAMIAATVLVLAFTRVPPLMLVAVAGALGALIPW
jgi:chromate transport protein ChrA